MGARSAGSRWSLQEQVRTSLKSNSPTMKEQIVVQEMLEAYVFPLPKTFTPSCNAFSPSCPMMMWGSLSSAWPWGSGMTDPAEQYKHGPQRAGKV